MTHEARTESALTVLPASAGTRPHATNAISGFPVPDSTVSATAAATAAAS